MTIYVNQLVRVRQSDPDAYAMSITIGSFCFSFDVGSDEQIIDRACRRVRPDAFRRVPQTHVALLTRYILNEHNMLTATFEVVPLATAVQEVRTVRPSSQRDHLQNYVRPGSPQIREFRTPLVDDWLSISTEERIYRVSERCWRNDPWFREMIAVNRSSFGSSSSEEYICRYWADPRGTLIDPRGETLQLGPVLDAHKVRSIESTVVTYEVCAVRQPMALTDYLESCVSSLSGFEQFIDFQDRPDERWYWCRYYSLTPIKEEIVVLAPPRTIEQFEEEINFQRRPRKGILD